MAGTKYSSFVVIASLVKSNLGEQCLINILMNFSSDAIRDYLEYAKIYWGISQRKRQILLKWFFMGILLVK